MKVGDLVLHKRRGWMALVLKINNANKSADIVWIGNPAPQLPAFDNYSINSLELINESW